MAHISTSLDDDGLSVRRPALLPLFGVLTLLLVAVVLSAHWLGNKIEINILQRDIRSIHEKLEHEFAEQILFFKSQLLVLAESDVLYRRFLAGDRQALLEKSLPIMEALRTNLITHLYFHRTDRVNFLRVHNLDMHSDPINRATLVQAEQTGHFTFGMEFGRSGTLTLRAILPWRYEGQLIGYLELGKEIGHLVLGLQQSFNLPLYTFMHREYLGRPWQNVSGPFGIALDQDSFADLVFVGMRDTSYPKGLREYIAGGLWRNDDPQKSISAGLGKEDTHFFSLPVRDTQNRIICRVVGVVDFSEYRNMVQTHRYVVIITTIALALLLGLFFNHFLKRVEVRIRNTSNTLSISERILRNTLEAFEHGILIINGAGIITHVNSHLSDAWSVSKEMAIQRRATHLLPHALRKLANPKAFISRIKHFHHPPAVNHGTVPFKDGRIFEHKTFSLPCTNGTYGQVWVFRDITQQKAMERQEEHALQSRIAISALLETGVEPLSLEEQLSVALNIILTVPWLSIQYKGSIFLMDEEGQHLVLAAQRGLHPTLLTRCAQTPMGYCLCGRAAQRRQMVYASHVTSEHDVDFPEMQPHGHYCAPILFRERLLGVLNLYVPNGHVYNPNEEAFLTTISYTLASLIELRTTKSSLQEKEAFSAALLATAPALVVVMDLEKRITLFNQACQHLTEYHEDEVLGQQVADFLVPTEEREMLQEKWQQLLAGQTPNHHENHWLTKEGNRRFISWSNNVVRNADGSLRSIIATGMDITERKQAEERLQHMAGHDPLTGVPNRRLFHENLTKAIAYAMRDGSKLAVLYLDLDHFKAVNDQLGHAAGDRLLIDVVERLQAIIRTSDTLARMGGDEFAIILTNVTAPSVVEHVARKILAEIVRPFIIQREECHIGTSIGISLLPEHGTDAENLLKNADRAMYVVKEQGRNQYRFSQT